MLAHNPQTAIANAVNSNSSEFYDSWGSSYFENPKAGRDWATVSAAGEEEPPTEVRTLTESTSQNFWVAPYATGQYALDLPESTPLLNVKVDGPGILSEKYGYTHLNDAWFCTAQSCDCPADETGTPPQWQPLPPVAELGVSGSAPWEPSWACKPTRSRTTATQPRPARRRAPRRAPQTPRRRLVRASCSRPAVARQFNSADSRPRIRSSSGAKPRRARGHRVLPTGGNLSDDGLWVEPSVAAAKALYETGFDATANSCAAQSNCLSTSPLPDLGDEASLVTRQRCSGLTENGDCAGFEPYRQGTVRVANDVFDIQESDSRFNLAALLAQAVMELCPGCTSPAGSQSAARADYP